MEEKLHILNNLCLGGVFHLLWRTLQPQRVVINHHLNIFVLTPPAVAPQYCKLHSSFEQQFHSLPEKFPKSIMDIHPPFYSIKVSSGKTINASIDFCVTSHRHLTLYCQGCGERGLWLLMQLSCSLTDRITCYLGFALLKICWEMDSEKKDCESSTLGDTILEGGKCECILMIIAKWLFSKQRVFRKGPRFPKYSSVYSWVCVCVVICVCVR